MVNITYPKPPFPEQPQSSDPGITAPMEPKPDHGEQTYRGSGRLAGKVALITGGDSGIGRAVAIAFAREGADVAVVYLDEHDDAKETAKWVEEAGRSIVLIPADITDRAQCVSVVKQTVEKYCRIDVLVNNAAHQKSFEMGLRHRRSTRSSQTHCWAPGRPRSGTVVAAQWLIRRTK